MHFLFELLDGLIDFFPLVHLAILVISLCFLAYGFGDGLVVISHLFLYLCYYSFALARA
ncbi:hypothetical protein LguiA_026082 [Lonicera macranthoides]